MLQDGYAVFIVIERPATLESRQWIKDELTRLLVSAPSAPGVQRRLLNDTQSPVELMLQMLTFHTTPEQFKGDGVQ